MTCRICTLESTELHKTLADCVRALVEYVRASERESVTTDELLAAKEDLRGDIRDLENKIDCVESELRGEIDRLE